MATRTSSSSQKGPLFTGMLIGLILGLAIAIAVALFIRRNDPFLGKLAPTPTASAPSTPPALEGAGNAPPAALSAAPAAPEVSHVGPQVTLPSASVPSSTEAADAIQYYLQAGAFKDPGQAQALKAELALLGLEAQIQTVEGSDGTPLQRVRLGPYTDMNQVSAARQLLAQNNINADLIKITPIH